MSKSPAPGLYSPAFEHDSCGFGLIAQLDSKASRWLVETAVSALARPTFSPSRSCSLYERSGWVAVRYSGSASVYSKMR